MSVQNHADFFARLVELVPAKFYLHTDSDRVNLKYVKKSVRDEAKAAFKAQYKAAKMAKMDPDRAKTTLDLQREAAVAAAEGARLGGGGGDDAAAAPATPLSAEGHAAASRLPAEGTAAPLATLTLSEGKPPSREELRERLQKKLEVMRQQRKADELAGNAEQAKAWREQALASGRKRAKKRPLEGEEATAAGQEARGAQPKHKAPAAAPVAADPETRQTFSALDFGDGGRRKQKRLSKAQLLAKAEAREAGETPPKGQESKLKEKNQKAWQGRLAKQTEDQKTRQNKRQEHISTRIQKGKDKKKDRREKKLLRAGFEGRKAGFITPGKAPAAS